MIRRDASSVPGDLVLRVSLTETATQFLSKRVIFDRDLATLISQREEEYRRNEERRLADTASRSLAPIVVRTSGPQDVPTAQILRRALLASAAGDFEDAFLNIETARRLNPDLWEVDRVEGFIRAAAGEYTAASTCYESAYRKADNEGRAVVAHFYAGHLARNMREITRAIQYERQAHATLANDETAMALGNYLVWNREFEEGIRLIESASKSLDGRAKLIAITSLARAYLRWAEYARDEERNPTLQYRRGQQAFSIAAAALEAGISDKRLVNIASECAVTTLQGATTAVTNSASPANLTSWIDDLAKIIVRFVDTRSWPRLIRAVESFKRSRAVPAAAQRLYATVAELQRGPEDASNPTSNTPLYGEVMTLKESYGFIRHPYFPSNIYFHADDIIGGNGIEGLNTGALVSFRVEEGARGPRAREVSRRP